MLFHAKNNVTHNIEIHRRQLLLDRHLEIVLLEQELELNFNKQTTLQYIKLENMFI